MSHGALCEWALTRAPCGRRAATAVLKDMALLSTGACISTAVCPVCAHCTHQAMGEETASGGEVCGWMLSGVVRRQRDAARDFELIGALPPACALASNR